MSCNPKAPWERRQHSKKYLLMFHNCCRPDTVLVVLQSVVLEKNLTSINLFFFFIYEMVRQCLTLRVAVQNK